MSTGSFFALVGALLGFFQPAKPPSGSIVERLGYPPDAKLLIVHADDFGMCHSVNVATVEAMSRGSVTSASVMAPCAWFPEAAALARENPSLDIGIHITLNSEWRRYRWGPVAPLSEVRSLVDGDGFLFNTFVKTWAHGNPAEVEREIRAQVERVLAFGIRPTHLDSHMGTVFMRQEFFDAYRKIAHEYQLPYLLPRPTGNLLKALDPRLKVSTNGTFKAIEESGDVVIDHLIMGIDAPPDKRKEAYLRLIADLKPGLTQLIIHCGTDSEELRAITNSWAQRNADRQAFTDPDIKRALDAAGVHLIGWAELKKMQYGSR
ncbi:MAG: polysaccharide deacetylase family protein [Candidatus Sumerlaeia bacterium]|nr:polysaccharide deacetylase family protein [Candidatus Sumerlaeia bacterium]